MSDFTDAIKAIDEKIQHHAGEAKRHRSEVERLTTSIGHASSALTIQESTVESLRKARKILTDAESASRNDITDRPINDNPLL